MQLRLRVCVFIHLTFRSTHCKAREAVEEEEWEEPEEEEEEEASSLVVRICWRARKSIEDVDEKVHWKSRFEPQDQEFMYLFQRCWKKFCIWPFGSYDSDCSFWISAHESLNPRMMCKEEEEKEEEWRLIGRVNTWCEWMICIGGLQQLEIWPIRDRSNVLHYRSWSFSSFSCGFGFQVFQAKWATTWTAR